MDGVGGPSGYSRGYTTDEFLTEAQIAQMQGKKAPKYGASLPPPHVALSDRTPTEFALSVHGTDPNHFKSTTTMDMETIHKLAAPVGFLILTFSLHCMILNLFLFLPGTRRIPA